MSKVIPQKCNGVIDLKNSSTTPLGISATFTGSWINIVQAGIIYINVYSDAASATDGLEVDQSSDGTNVDHTDNFSIPAAKGKNFSINPHSKYYRVKYTNGTVGQTQFRLQSVIKETGLDSSHSIKEVISTDDDARLRKSILMIKANDLDEYRNIEIHNPMPMAGTQLYPQDVNLTHSDQGNFSGSLNDLLDDRWTPIVDSTATNPKILKYEFERPLQTSIIGLVTETGSFSNTVIKYGLSTTPDFTLLDESADSTAKTFLIAPSAPITLNRLIFEFHTANTITLTGMNLAKSQNSIAQIQGQTNDGEVIAIGATTGGNLKVSLREFGDTAAIDAFARLRVSNPFTIVDSKQLHDKQPLFFDESTGGSATSTHSVADARTRLTVTASASDFAIRQSKQRFNYQPGKSQLIFMTFYAPQETGLTKRLGAFSGTGTNYMTPKNGIFLEITDSDVSFNIAKNGTTTESVSQANWNVDPMDGTGPSGITLDLDAIQIFSSDFEWLGVGRVRCGFVIQGIIYYCHYFYHANDPSFTSVYMSSPNRPIRYDIQSDGTGGGDLDHICSTVISEGGIELTGILRSVDMGTTHIDANTAGTSYAMVGIRLKSTYIDISVLPEYFSILSLTNDSYRWSLRLNPTVAGTFTYADITNSACQYATGATANTVTGGTVIDSGYGSQATAIDRKFVTSLRMGSTISGTVDELVLCVTPISSNADYLGSLTFRELL